MTGKEMFLARVRDGGLGTSAKPVLAPIEMSDHLDSHRSYRGHGPDQPKS